MDFADPFFNPGDLIDFLLDDEAENAETDWNLENTFIPDRAAQLFVEKIGGTTISTSGLQIAETFVQHDADVQVSEGELTKLL